MHAWEEHGNALHKTVTFGTFLEALAFVQKVGTLAEMLQHHPDISLSYTKVTLTTTTHDAGSVVTQKDRELAEAIDALLEE